MKKILLTIIGSATTFGMVGCAGSADYSYGGQQAAPCVPRYVYGQTCERPMPPAGLGYYRTDRNFVPKPVPVGVPGGGHIMTPYPVLYTSPMVRAVEQW